MNCFTFRPVGQGLFYTGSLGDGSFHFIYDCGSWDMKVPLYKTYINEQVDRYVDEIRGVKAIDLAVISHLHLDHMNGLYRLAKQKVIKKLYLPYLGGEDLLNVLLLAGIYGEGQDNAESRNLFEFISRLYVRDIQISDSRDISSAIENIRNVVVIGQNQDGSRDENGQVYFRFTENYYNYAGQKYWEFKFSNKALSQDVIDNFYSEFLREMNGNALSSPSRLYDYIVNEKNALNHLAKIYKRTITTISPNATSVVLYHYPLYSSNYQISNYQTDFYCNTPSCAKICPNDIICATSRGTGKTLLTGDAEFDMKMVNDLTGGKYALDADIMQIPHHGSSPNMKLAKACNVRAKNYVIPFGLGNSHKHPDASTLKLLNEEKIYLVTQNQGIVYSIK